VINAERDLDELLEIVMDAVIEISGAARGFLILEGEEPGIEQARIVARNMDHGEIRDPNGCFSTSIAEQVLQTGEPVLTPHANKDRRYSSRHSVRALRLRSILCIPLRVCEIIIGVIYLDNDEEAKFSEGDVEFISSFADPAAIALQNAKLVDQLESRKQELVRTNNQLTGLTETSRAMMIEQDVERLLEMIIEQATLITDGDRSSLFLIDHARNSLVTKVAQHSETEEISLPLGKGIAGHVARTREPYNVSDAYADPHFDQETDRLTGYKTQSILAVPLLTHGQEVLGVIEVINKRTGSFMKYDEELLGALAAHAATALDNQRLLKHYLRKQQIEHELQMACRIQSLLLPSEIPAFPNLEMSAFYKSYEEAGGDYYDFFKLSETRLAVVIADVSGHGISAAMLMATARASLRAYVETLPDLSTVLDHLNRALVQDMAMDRFMTLFLAILDLERQELTYTNAGHTAPLMYRPSDDSFIELSERSLPLGMVKEPTYRQSAPIPLHPQDLILMMTDGVWEAVDETDEEFGRERLCALIRDCQDMPMTDLVGQIYQSVSAYCKPLSLNDDFTLLGLRHVATGQQTVVEKTGRTGGEQSLPMA